MSLHKKSEGGGAAVHSDSSNEFSQEGQLCTVTAAVTGKISCAVTAVETFSQEGQLYTVTVEVTLALGKGVSMS